MNHKKKTSARKKTVPRLGEDFPHKPMLERSEANKAATFAIHSFTKLSGRLPKWLTRSRGAAPSAGGVLASVWWLLFCTKGRRNFTPALSFPGEGTARGRSFSNVKAVRQIQRFVLSFGGISFALSWKGEGQGGVEPVFRNKVLKRLAAVSLQRLLPATSISCLLLLTTGCHLVPRLAPVDVTSEGWKVQQGQAVWKPKADAPELAGDLLIATNEKLGRQVVQFTKTPIPFVIAQTTTNSWQIEIPVQKKFYSGYGHPPTRLAWFYLPDLLNGAPPPKNWTFEQHDDQWKLVKSSGETIEGFLEK